MTEGTQPDAPETAPAVTIADVHAGAQVISEGRYAVAECPGCAWRSRPSRWWAVAQDRADTHNNKEHSVLNPAPPKEPR